MRGRPEDAPFPSAIVALALLACAGPGPRAVVVHGPIDRSDLVALTLAPGEPLTLLLPADASRLEVPGFCPVAVEDEVTLRPLVDVESEPPPFGFAAPFRIEVQAGCAEARAGTLVWRSEAGRALGVEDGGFVVTGLTPPSTLSPRGFGIVPVSAAAAGEDVLHLRFRLGDVAIERSVRVRAAHRASGLPSVPLGATLHLAGGPFAVREAPVPPLLGGGGALTTATFVAEGRYVLAAGDRTLAIRVGTHRGTPLDCGRSECHAEASSAALGSPMARAAFDRLLATNDDAMPCAAPCHTTSEPGLPDGGFAHVARDHGWRAPAHAADLATLPRALRRAAGVGCTACHGPGAIPEEGARWAILRSDVCAVCHDLPPRYGHVAALGASAMARADADPRTRAGECARCHTTDGFLARSGGPRREVPDEARPLGIACAACHAPHGAHGEHLVRQVTLPPELEHAERDRICVACHGDPRRAAQAQFVLGEPTHAALGCLGCHGAPAGDGLAHGGDHAFAIDPSRCAAAGCHEAAPSAPAPLPIDHLAQHTEGSGGALLAADRAAWAHGPVRYGALARGLSPSP